MKIFEKVRDKFVDIAHAINVMRYPDYEFGAVLSNRLNGWDDRHELDSIVKNGDYGNYQVVLKNGKKHTFQTRSSTLSRTVEMLLIYKGVVYIWLNRQAQHENALEILEDTVEFIKYITSELDCAGKPAACAERMDDVASSWKALSAEAAALGCPPALRSCRLKA